MEKEGGGVSTTAPPPPSTVAGPSSVPSPPALSPPTAVFFRPAANPLPATESADEARNQPEAVSPSGLHPLKRPTRIQYLVAGMAVVMLLELFWCLWLLNRPAAARRLADSAFLVSVTTGSPSAQAAAGQSPNGQGPTDLVVSPTGGQFATISEAFRQAGPGARIIVRPGVHQERIVLDRAVEIIVPHRPLWIGRPFCVRSRACISVFSSQLSTNTCSGGFM